MNDSILGTISVNGTGNLTVSANDSSVNLSNVSSSIGTVTINDTSSSVNIVGSAGNDVLNLNSGNDTVDLGDGSDIINVSIANLNTSDNISDTGASGTDILNITSTGTIDSASLIDVSGIETLNLSSGNDTVTFDNVAEFNSFINEFNDIVDAGGNDSLSFGATAVSGDLDFSKLSEFENLNLSSANDNITLSGDEPNNINGLAGNDNFTLDFSNIGTLIIDGGTNSGGDDKVTATGSTTTISSDSAIFGSGAFTNIEALDITNLVMNTTADGVDGNAEFTINDSLISSWTNGGNSLKLTLDADSASKLEFTDSSNTKYGGDDADTTAISNGTYTLDNGVDLIINGL